MALDTTGQQFGNWIVLKELGHGKVLCQCQCQDKTVKELYKKSVLEGRTKSCGCIRKEQQIKIGDTYEEWTVIQILKDRKVLCRCSCGTEKEVFGPTLKNGMSKSCGCRGKYRKAQDKIKDHEKIKPKNQAERMIGSTFNEWTVIGAINKDKVLCRCSCGTEREVYVKNIKNGASKSCGCKKLENSYNTYKNKLVGIKYGYWTVLGKGDKEGTYRCRCICGIEKDVFVTSLNSGNSTSCGCKTFETRRNTMLATYGEIATNKKHSRNKEQIEAVLSRENLLKYIKNLNKKPFVYELCQSLELQEARMLELIHKYELEEQINWDKNQSKKENDILEFIKSNYDGNIISHCRNIIYPRELDIYIPDKKLAIEFNGNYWHSSDKLDENYHIEKTVACMNKGIQLFHIFEYEWDNVRTRDIIRKLLLNKLKGQKKIYARNTVIKQVSNDCIADFYNNNHLQGAINSSINLCLYSNDTIVESMSFSKSRFDNKDCVEITRMCKLLNTNVIGGTEKLFKFALDSFIKELDIISYCDISKFNGTSYNKLGFTLDKITKPNYVWVKNDNVLSRYKTQKSKLIEKGLGTEEQTEDEIMKNLGYMKIYDCGNIKFTNSK